MTATTKPVRKDSAVSGRFYEVEGARYPSVTHILTAIAKPALVAWSANTERAACLEAAADLYEEWMALGIAQVPPPIMPRSWYVTTLTERLGKVKAHQKELAQAGEIGTQIHQTIEWLMRSALGRSVGPKPVISDAAQWAVMAFEAWAHQVSLEPVLIETTVYSTVHGYAGTMDLLARVNGALTLIDFKSSKAIFPESFLQSAAYQIALIEMGYERPATALIVRLPKNEADPGFEVATVPPIEELFPVFLAVKELWKWSYKNDEAWRSRQKA